MDIVFLEVHDDAKKTTGARQDEFDQERCWVAYKSSDVGRVPSAPCSIHSVLKNMKSLSVLIPLAIASIASARTFTVYNGCPFTIWCVVTVIMITPLKLIRKFIGPP